MHVKDEAMAMGTNGSAGVQSSPAAGFGEALADLESARRPIVVTHENPDGDALGSLIAMQGILEAIGKECEMFIDPRDLPLPQEYSFFPLKNLICEPPADFRERTIVFLDCGNLSRNPAQEFGAHGVHIVNIDHHHDNTRFGTVNLVDATASCTAEIVWALMHALGVTPTRTVAEALYVGLITDTGRFMYENTGPRAHVMAAELIEAGVDTHAIYRRLYEDMPYAKLELLGRALARVERHDGGALTVARVTREDFEAVGAEDSYTEGIIDHLRSVEQTKVAALSREVEAIGSNGAGVRKKVSLRSTDGEVDVSAIARAGGGGGHRQAAGFTTQLGDDELVAFLREQVAAQLGEASARGLVSRQQLA
jgi:phosphoesterase RecJ-like protein